jgi:RNA-directed DNA polymerase
LGNLATPERIRTLQKKLYVKAKSSPEFRFYSLYDKICRVDVLEHAYLLARANGGVEGVDGQTFEQIEAEGREGFLAQLREELVEKRYKPQPVLRVYIPKRDGSQRPLGIPTIRDRTVQTAVRLVLEPIFEADFTDNAHAYRPRRSARGAVREVLRHARRGHRQVVDADLSKYFDTIPHADLLRSVRRRVCDKAILGLVKAWLRVPIVERDAGGRSRTTGGKTNPRGTPQGGVISPLLANIYMRRFLKYWERQRLPERLQARIVNYADDFVILCREASVAQEALRLAGTILTRMGLTLNPEKTRVVDANQDSFDFLGYTFGHVHRRDNGQRYFGARPSLKAQTRLGDSVRSLLQRGNHAPLGEVFGELNRRVRGWGNYFSVDTVSLAYRRMDARIRERAVWWLSRRYKVGNAGTRRFRDEVLYGQLGLLRLQDVLRTRRSHALA